MSRVYNWQIGRDMSYPYEEAHPSSQYAFVFNTNRCIGCQTCTMACKSTWTFSRGQELMWWNNVETKPYGGYPLFWDVKLLKMLHEADPGGQRWSAKSGSESDEAPFGTFEGKTIFEAAETLKDPKEPKRALGYLPSDEEWTAPNIYEDTPTGKIRGPNDWTENRGPARAQGLVLPPGPRLQSLHLSRLLGGLSAASHLQAPGRRHRFDRPEPLPRLPQVRRGLPLQEGDVPAGDARQREMCRLLPAH